MEDIVRTVFRETLLGPEHIEKPAAYNQTVTESEYPDLEREMAHFRVNVRPTLQYTHHVMYIHTHTYMYMVHVCECT